MGAEEKLALIDPTPVCLTELPQADDEDLLRQLDGRYGGPPESYFFRLVSVPLALLQAADQIPAEGVAYYDQLARADSIVLADRTLYDDEDAGRLSDGAARAAIVRAYRDDYLAGRPVAPPLIDCYDEEGDELLSILDGFHRACGAFEAGLLTLACYELLAEND
jgi:hypothetical protein